MLRSDLCDYSDVYIIIKGRVTLKERMMLKPQLKS